MKIDPKINGTTKIQNSWIFYGYSPAYFSLGVWDLWQSKNLVKNSVTYFMDSPIEYRPHEQQARLRDRLYAGLSAGFILDVGPLHFYFQ